MEIRPVKTDEDYKAALDRIEELIDCEENSVEEEELEVISLLVWHYEQKHHTIEKLDSIEVIKTSEAN